MKEPRKETLDFARAMCPECEGRGYMRGEDSRGEPTFARECPVCYFAAQVVDRWIESHDRVLRVEGSHD